MYTLAACNDNHMHAFLHDYSTSGNGATVEKDAWGDHEITEVQCRPTWVESVEYVVCVDESRET